MHVHRTEAGPPGGAPPPRDEAPEGFDLLLALHGNEARTATAEGQETDPEDRGDRGVRAHGDPSVTPGHRERAERAEREDDEAATRPVEPPVDAAPRPVEDPAAEPAAPPAVTGEEAAVAPEVRPAVVDPAAAVRAAVAQLAGADVAAAPAPVATAATDAAIAPPAVAAAGDVAAAAAIAGDPAAEGVPADADASSPALPVATSDGAESLAPADAAEEGTRKPTATAPPTEPGSAAGAKTDEAVAAVTRPAPERSPNAEGARAAEVHAAKAAGQKPGPAADKAAAAAAESLPPAAPAPTEHVAAPLRADAAGRALRLAETTLQLRELVEVAAARGVARARLQLHPAELGGIEVRLRVTAEGLTAAIAAERPEAAQALQQASAELRRALEQRGLTVLSVEVTLTGVAGGGQTGGSALNAGGERSTSGTGTDSNGGQEAAADAMEADPTAPRGVPAGALVDVLA